LEGVKQLILAATQCTNNIALMKVFNGSDKNEISSNGC